MVAIYGMASSSACLVPWKEDPVLLPFQLAVELHKGLLEFLEEFQPLVEDFKNNLEATKVLSHRDVMKLIAQLSKKLS
jgi:hypothetical protein